MNRIIVIPAYNPDNKLITLINNLIKYNVDIVVVNDGSDKDTIFNKIKDKVIYLSHNINKGKGCALKTAYKYIKDNYDKYMIVTMDCDGQHKIEDALKLFDELDKDKNILVLGKRIDNDKVPFINKMGHIITRIVFRLVTGKYIYDTQTGLRAFTYINIDYMINTLGDRFEYEMNVLLYLKSIKVKEIEIETIYNKDDYHTHFKVIKDSFMVYKVIFKYLISSLSSALIDYLLYVIINILSGNIIISNVLARVISSIYNYNMNKNYVFKSKKKYSFISYFLLVITLLILNTIFVYLLSLYINKYIAKIIIDIFIFIFSYIIQKYIIFKGGNDENIDN